MSEQTTDRILDKLDSISEKLSFQGELLAKHTVLLENGAKRTSDIEEGMKPLRQTDHIIRGGVKSIGLIATIITIIYSLVGIKQ